MKDLRSVMRGRTRQRGRPHRLVVRVVLAALGVLLVQSGSAATATKPYTANFTPGSVAGGSSVQIGLDITNLSSNQSLGSANVTAASSASGDQFSITSAIPTVDVDPTSTTTLLKLRNLNLAPNTTLHVTITVTTPCTAADYTWGIQAKQSNDFNGPPGNAFTFQTSGSNLITSVAAGGCKLAWAVQPTNGVVNTQIVGTGGATVEVDAQDASGNPLAASGTVTLTQTAGSFSSAVDGTGNPCAFSGTTATMSGGKATFPNLKTNCTGSGFKLTASATGFASKESDPFNIYVNLTDCTGQTVCNTPKINIGTDTTAQVEGDGNFVFIGIDSVVLSPVPAGCAHYTSTGAAPVVVTDQRTTLGGDVFVTYGIRKTLITKLYGNTQGQQFIPICAGARRIALVNGKTVPIPCNQSYPGGTPQTPWTAKELGADGKFDGNVTPALCDGNPDSAGYGYFWGILGSFQDYTNSDSTKIIDGSVNPTVTAWTSDTTYRYFTIRYPSSSGAPATPFAGVPWDGWNF
jgi:hypothetical protein